MIDLYSLYSPISLYVDWMWTSFVEGYVRHADNLLFCEMTAVLASILLAIIIQHIWRLCAHRESWSFGTSVYGVSVYLSSRSFYYVFLSKELWMLCILVMDLLIFHSTWSSNFHTKYTKCGNSASSREDSRSVSYISRALEVMQPLKLLMTVGLCLTDWQQQKSLQRGTKQASEWQAGEAGSAINQPWCGQESALLDKHTDPCPVRGIQRGSGRMSYSITEMAFF